MPLTNYETSKIPTAFSISKEMDVV